MTFVIVFLLLVGGVFWLVRQRDKSIQVPAEKKDVIHYAQDPRMALEKIRIKAFYFLPKDQVASQSGSWRQDLEAALAQTGEFYGLQLHNSLGFGFDVYPTPVTGWYEKEFYDGKDTNRGNPHALETVREELITRAFSPEGDLYKASFASKNPEEKQVIAILYEGVGASATLIPGDISLIQRSDLIQMGKDETLAFLVSRYFLDGESYKDYGNSIFAHEFGHILGLVDNYDYNSDKPLEDDIMGSGRYRPLNATYLSLKNKKSLGLSY